MSSADKLSSIRSVLSEALEGNLDIVREELEASDAEPAKATRLLAHISAAQQLIAMIMANIQHAEKAQAASTAGDADADKLVAKLNLGRDALLTSLESLTNDLKIA